MVFVLLSPAKTMAFDRKRPSLIGGAPLLQNKAVELADILREYNASRLGKLLDVSPKLAELNVARFKGFAARPAKENSDAAILAYRGDTYIGFDAASLKDADLKWSHDHIGILTGLYGLLRPLDAIQAYRLEMSTKLTNESGKDLYAFWADQITDAINKHIKKNKLKAVIGCASQEYLAAVDIDALEVPFIQCDFKEKRNGKLVTVGLLAKRARGMMARYVVENRVKNSDDLKSFDSGKYKFDKKLSNESHFVFVR